MRVVSFDIGIKNLSHCAIDGRKVVHWNTVTLCPSQKKPSVQDTTIALFAYLDWICDHLKSLGWFREGFTVLIEQQLSRNAQCKAVQHKLYAYFALESHRHKIDMKIIQCPAKTRYCTSQKNFKGTKSQKYSQRKKQSISDAQTMIETCPVLVERFSNCKKKDDLADSLMQIVVWFKISASDPIVAHPNCFA